MYEGFSHFTKEVRQSHRFFWSESTLQFLSQLSQTLPGRETILEMGRKMFRSQVGYQIHLIEGEEGIKGFSESRMKPLRKFATEGRANPKGIPYLYLSTDPETSMSELRPSVGQYVSCAKFEAKKDLRLVDCHSMNERFTEFNLLFDPLENSEDIAQATWFQICKAFSKPVKNDHSNTSYIPTQILSEFIKSKEFDGLYFKSHLGEGHNIVLFDIEAAIFKHSGIAETKSVNYKFEISKNPNGFRRPNDL